MHVLFLHDAFPAQFGRLGLELKRRHGWKCSFLVQSLSSCPTPTPEMLQELDLNQLPLTAEHRSKEGIPWPQIFGMYLEQCQSVYDALRARPDLKPDLVVAHGGRGAPTLFLKDLLDCPIINYCEYYFGTSHRDISYRIDLPPAEPHLSSPAASTPPRWLHWSIATPATRPRTGRSNRSPRAFIPRSMSTSMVSIPRFTAPVRRTRHIGEVSLPGGTKVVTFVARGLESIRGFDLFMQVADRICRQRSDVLFVVVGGEEIHYGWDKLHTGSPSFKQWVLSQGKYDLSRFLFRGRILPEHLAEILRLSDLHIYLSAPFVVSWSLFNAMATGVPVLASDVPPVREVIAGGVNGLLEPLFDIDRLTATALQGSGRPGCLCPAGRCGAADN